MELEPTVWPRKLETPMLLHSEPLCFGFPLWFRRSRSRKRENVVSGIRNLPLLDGTTPVEEDLKTDLLT